VWQRGKSRDLGTLGGADSSAQAINAHGQVVGWSYARLPDGRIDTIGFVWENGTMRALGLRFVVASPPWIGWGPSNALNDRGQVVGFVRGDRHHYTRAAVWESGKIRTLDRFGTSCKGLDINELGAVVGFCAVKPHELAHPSLWLDGKVRDLGFVHGDRGFAVALNNRGQVIGNARAGSGKFHAFVWEDGKMTDLGTLGGKESVAVAINERGEVVGSSVTKSGETHAVLWTLRRGG
jgi:probable HAF family extracellular repeat protein